MSFLEKTLGIYNEQQHELAWEFGDKEKYFLAQEGFGEGVSEGMVYAADMDGRELMIWVTEEKIFEVRVLSYEQEQRTLFEKKYEFDNEKEFHDQYVKMVNRLKLFFEYDQRRKQISGIFNN